MGGEQFRHATPADAQTLLAIKQEAIGSIDTDDYTDEQLAAWQPDDDAVSDFRRAIESNRFELLLAEREGTAVAYGGLHTPKNRIDAVYVQPAYSGEGIATSLVKQFESRAQMGALPELKIVSSLNARSFYESLGYWDFGRKTREIDGIELEFAIMRKVFEFGET